jgi:RNA polymerase sigma-70 factor, ECF subfamily
VRAAVVRRPVGWLKSLPSERPNRPRLLGVRSEQGRCACPSLDEAAPADLAGRLTSPTQAAQRVEMQIRLQEVINAMDPIDREVLTLRHFEELSNVETAQVLGIQKSAASNRYLRALKRLKDTLASMPGLLDN